MNARDKDRRTPLHEAALLGAGNIKVAALLIKKGADANAQDKEHDTPAMLAEKNGYTELAAMLRKAQGKRK